MKLNSKTKTLLAFGYILFIFNYVLNSAIAYEEFITPKFAVIIEEPFYFRPFLFINLIRNNLALYFLLGISFIIIGTTLRIHRSSNKYYMGTVKRIQDLFLQLKYRIRSKPILKYNYKKIFE